MIMFSWILALRVGKGYGLGMAALHVHLHKTKRSFYVCYDGRALMRSFYLDIATLIILIGIS